MLLIEPHYLPSTAYFSLLAQHREILFEVSAYHVKSSYRNRCYLAGPNGRTRLTVPLAQGRNQKQLLKDVRISYESRWQPVHWQGICSFYRNTPWFEFYEDGLAPFYHKRFEFLVDFNMELLHWIAAQLRMEKHWTFTDSFSKEYPADVTDFRDKINPRSSPGFSLPGYQQVFESRTGFLAPVSIVDLLFNMGNEAKEFLVLTPTPNS